MGLLYTKLKIFNFNEKLYSLSPHNDSILAPIHIRIKPTNVCSHNCWYCAYKAENLQLGKDMVKKDFIPRDKMMEIIDDIADMGVKAVTFSGGGDPFCYPYLLDAARKLSQTSIKFASLTNGALLDGEIAEVFAHNATWIRVSIDGWDSQSYAFYRGVKESEFAKIMNNIESFKKIGGKCYLGISLVVDHKNAGHIYKFIQVLRDRGVDSVKVSPCIVSNNGADNSVYHKEIFNVVKDQVQKAVRDFYALDFEVYDSYHELEDKFTKDYTWCPYLQILPVIGADLNIYPCQDKAYNLDCGIIGSIKEIRFKDFWLKEKNKFFKIDPSRHCNHHCVANEKNRLILHYLDIDKEHLDFV